MKVLEQNPEELNKLKEGNLDEQSVLEIFAKNELTSYIKIVCQHFEVDK